MATVDSIQLDRQFGDVSVPVLVAMAGLPGTGKSTLAEVIGARLGATVVSVDPIEHAILTAGIDSDQPTGLAAYLVAASMAETALNAGHSVIVDAVNAAEPARLQWRDVAARTGAVLRFVEVTCSDNALHADRLEKRTGRVQFADVYARAVEQSLKDYEPWTGSSGELPRVTLDTVHSIGVNVDTALAFIAA